ncbi:AAA domain protein [compost metagenome]
MELKKASRQQVKLRLNISAPSGAGKTYSALRMARGLVGDWTKIAVVDTENGSASLYSHLGDFNVIDIQAPFTPEKYIQAMDICLNAGMEAIILDSTTHEWNCLLEENEKLAQAKYRGNTWSAWSQTTPRHDNFVNKVLQCPAHVITCTRSKTETVMGEDKKVKKVGMKDQQREGWEYELTVSLNIDRDTHLATPSKDRTNLFENSLPFLITEQTGEKVREWCESGAAIKSGDVLLREAASMVELANIYKGLSHDDQKRYADIKDECKAKFADSPADVQPEPPADVPRQTLPGIPTAKYNSLIKKMKDADSDHIGLLKIARENFTFSAAQEKELTQIIASKINPNKAA